MNKTLFAAAMLSLFASTSFAQAASAPAVAESDMSKAKAARLHKDDRQIRQEERDMASQNGGHITKQEQRTLNHQENKVSQKIGK